MHTFIMAHILFWPFPFKNFWKSNWPFFGHLFQVIELPLINPELFQRVGISPPKGCLLFGPPGMQAMHTQVCYLDQFLVLIDLLNFARNWEDIACTCCGQPAGCQFPQGETTKYCATCSDLYYIEDSDKTKLKMCSYSGCVQCNCGQVYWGKCEAHKRNVW